MQRKLTPEEEYEARALLVMVKITMQRKLTPEEYRAQALLLGLEYGEIGHVFYDPMKGNTGNAVDADTLEPVSSKEWTDRQENGPWLK